jgi:hypothetical protein
VRIARPARHPAIRDPLPRGDRLHSTFP